MTSAFLTHHEKAVRTRHHEVFLSLQGWTDQRMTHKQDVCRKSQSSPHKASRLSTEGLSMHNVNQNTYIWRKRVQRKVLWALPTYLFELIMPTILSNVVDREPMHSSKVFPTLRLSAATRIASETKSSEAALVMVLSCTGVKTCPHSLVYLPFR